MKHRGKNAVKAGIVFGLGMGFFCALLFIPLMTLVLMAEIKGISVLLIGPLVGIILSVILALFGGVLFGLLIWLFSKLQDGKVKELRAEVMAGTTVYYDDAANHLVGKEGVGGWLFLTEHSLYYKSFLTNIQVHELNLPFEEIEKVEAARFKVIGQSIRVCRKDGTVEIYVVNEPKTWESKINERMNRNGGEKE